MTSTEDRSRIYARHPRRPKANLRTFPIPQCVLFEHAVLVPLTALNGGAVAAFLTLVGAVSDPDSKLSAARTWVAIAAGAWSLGDRVGIRVPQAAGDQRRTPGTASRAGSDRVPR
jgi:hypothetical protein